MNTMNGISKRAAATAMALMLALPCGAAGGGQSSRPGGTRLGFLLKPLSFSLFRGARPGAAQEAPGASGSVLERPAVAAPMADPSDVLAGLSEPDAADSLGEHLAVVRQALDAAAEVEDATGEDQAGAAARINEAMTGERPVPTVEAVAAAVASSDWSSLSLEARVALGRERLRAAVAEVGKVIKGQDEAIFAGLAAAVMARGALFEAVPGTGKTELAKAIAVVTGAEMKRIQGTSDLMPSDISGSFGKKADEEGRKTAENFERGPVFTQMVLFDELNRSSPKAKSATLSPMAEKQVTVEGVTMPLDARQFTLATMNPIEQAGTFELSEAELDRFPFKVTMRQPRLQTMNEITPLNRSQAKRPKLFRRTTLEELAQVREAAEALPVTPGLVDYSNRVVMAAMPDGDAFVPEVAALVRYGLYTRAGIDLLQAATLDAVYRGQAYVSPENVERMAFMVLRHRIVLTAEARRAGWTPDAIIAEAIKAVRPRREGPAAR